MESDDRQDAHDEVNMEFMISIPEDEEDEEVHNEMFEITDREEIIECLLEASDDGDNDFSDDFIDALRRFNGKVVLIENYDDFF